MLPSGSRVTQRDFAANASKLPQAEFLHSLPGNGLLEVLLRLQISKHQASSTVNLVDMQAPTARQLATGFDHQQFYSYLPTNVELGATLLTAQQLESTQTLLQQNSAAIPDNTVCTAYQQIGGKGTAAVNVLLIL